MLTSESFEDIDPIWLPGQVEPLTWIRIRSCIEFLGAISGSASSATGASSGLHYPDQTKSTPRDLPVGLALKGRVSAIPVHPGSLGQLADIKEGRIEIQQADGLIATRAHHPNGTTLRRNDDEGNSR